MEVHKMRNRYPGICYKCLKLVEKNTGRFERLLGTWRVIHDKCI